MSTQTSKHPYLIANELMSSAVAQTMGLLTPEVHTRTVNGEKVFCSKWMNDRLTASEIAWEQHEDHGSLSSELMLLLCFDLFIMNTDRNYSNLLFLPDGQRLQVLAVDHDRAFFGVSREDDVFRHRFREGCRKLVHDDFVSFLGYFTHSQEDLDSAISIVESISADQIHDILKGIDRDFLDHKSRAWARKLIPLWISRIAECVSEAVAAYGLRDVFRS